MFWTRRNSHLSDEELSAYSDGELNGARLQAVAAHLAGCDDCSAALEGLREVSALISRLPEVEPGRSFVLTPSMLKAGAGIGQHGAIPAPKRQPFVFVPAVALTLLVALFAVDLSSSSSGVSTSNDESGTASQAMIAKDASSSAGAANSTGGAGAADAPLRSTFNAPEPTPTAAPSAPPATAQQAPSVAAPSTGPAATPSTSGQQPAQAPAPTTGGSSLVPVPPTKPSTESAVAPSPGIPPDAPAITGGVASEAVPAPAPAEVGTDSIGDGDDSSMRNRGGLNDGGTDWLRIAQALTAVVFFASLAYVLGSGLIKKGRSS